METTRKDVFTALDTERIYQKRRWGVRSPYDAGEFTEQKKPIESFILYMEDYLQEARRAASRLPDGYRTALDALRKVVALGVACFEQHGVAPRRLYETVINGHDGQAA
jgi:hypothetical protein